MIRDATLPLELSTHSVLDSSGLFGRHVHPNTVLVQHPSSASHLLTLDEVLLKDIGISRTDALAEGSQTILAMVTLS